MKHTTIVLIFFVFFITQFSVFAQDDQPLVTAINYGMSVEETITQHAFFDWWQLETQIGDTIVISMEADDGLQPLLGLLDAGGELVARSDTEAIAEVNGVSYLQYTTTTAGTYTIIATREGRDQGTTTGIYLLTVTNRNESTQSRPNPFLETEFRCSEWLLTNALTFSFSEDIPPEDKLLPGQPSEAYRISVYGLDGFEPVIRLQADIVQDRPLDCTDSAKATAGSQLDLPFLDEPIVITDDDADSVAMVTLTNSSNEDQLGDIVVSVGAKQGTSGRYIVVLEGVAIQERNDNDEFTIRRGAFASDTTLNVYMLGYPTNRLDPTIDSLDIETDISLTCDDIGQGDCLDIPVIAPSTIIIAEDGTTYAADRFDAGLRIDSPDNSQVLMTFRSRENSTSGEYIVVFVGELPAR